MTFDGFNISTHRLQASIQSTLQYAAKLGTFHVSELAEHLYGVEGWPSHAAAVHGMRFFVRQGLTAGWVSPVAPRDGFYAIQGVAHPPVHTRACV